MFVLRRCLPNVVRIGNVNKNNAGQIWARAQSSGGVPEPEISPGQSNKFYANPQTINQTFQADIHKCLSSNIDGDAAGIEPVTQYYFDGQGKAIRPRLIVTLSEAVNSHLEIPVNRKLIERQHQIALIAEMYHTASLFHDDVIDKAETRRGKEAINHKWDESRSVMAGDFTVAVSNIVLGQLRDPDVVLIMSEILHDLVIGELQQMSGNGNKNNDKTDRFATYLRKTYNKTASLMANSCKAVAHMASKSSARPDRNPGEVAEAAFMYGKNLGIAFQLVDDWLDFSASAEALGKPAAADLKLGLATAPVLFAADQFEAMEPLIKRRFSGTGDVEKAFGLVQASKGMEQTLMLARSYCQAALAAIEHWKPSPAKEALTEIVNSASIRNK